MAQLVEIGQPLRGVLSSCATLCVPECCGLDAFDFSPVHIASSLLQQSGHADPGDVASAQEQLRALRHVASGDEVTVEFLNASFDTTGWHVFLDTLEGNLAVALRLISEAESSQVDSNPD